MRWAVIFSDLLLLAFFLYFSKENFNQKYLILSVLNPVLILIDHGHF